MFNVEVPSILASWFFFKSNFKCKNILKKIVISRSKIVRPVTPTNNQFKCDFRARSYFYTDVALEYVGELQHLRLVWKWKQIGESHFLEQISLCVIDSFAVSS